MHVDRLALRWLAKYYIHLRASNEKQNGFCRYIVTNKVAFLSASYSACVVYTKTIIHLSVGESSWLGKHSPPLRWIIVKYNTQHYLGHQFSFYSLFFYFILFYILRVTSFFYSKAGGGQLENSCYFGHHTHPVIILPMIIINIFIYVFSIASVFSFTCFVIFV